MAFFKVSEVEAAEVKIEIPQQVQDYVRTLNGLRKDTNVELLSFDWSEPMLQDENGILYFLTWDSIKQVHHIEIECRQLGSMKALGSMAAFVETLKADKVVRQC